MDLGMSNGGRPPFMPMPRGGARIGAARTPDGLASAGRDRPAGDANGLRLRIGGGGAGAASPLGGAVELT